MPVEGIWDDETKTLFRIEMRDRWEWGEFDKVVKTGYDAIKGMKHNVNVIMAFYSDLPSGNAIPHLTYAGIQPTNVRHTVMINQSGLATDLFIQSLINAVDKVHEWEGPKFVYSLEEARTYLKGLEEK
jgi:hypothetical protein